MENYLDLKNSKDYEKLKLPAETTTKNTPKSIKKNSVCIAKLRLRCNPRNR